MVADTMELSGWQSSTTNVIDEHAELHLISNQNQAAFEALYLRYHPRIFRFVLRMLQSPDLAEEVTSDTLHAVWTSAGSFQGKSSVSTWIFGIAYRTALKAIRSRKRHTRFTDGAGDSEILVDTHVDNDPAVKTEIAAETKAVYAAIDKLNPAQKAVAELIALGYSSIEIGRIVDCPANTVKTRMFHARKKLHKLLVADTATTSE